MTRHWNGQRLRDLRGSMSQVELADALGVHRSAVIAWESGTTPTFANAVAIADLFGVVVDSLLAPHAEERGTADVPETKNGAAVA